MTLVKRVVLEAFEVTFSYSAVFAVRLTKLCTDCQQRQQHQHIHVAGAQKAEPVI